MLVTTMLQTYPEAATCTDINATAAGTPAYVCPSDITSTKEVVIATQSTKDSAQPTCCD